MQPIIFDHVNKVVVQVGADPGSKEKYEEIVEAQRPLIATAPPKAQ